MSEIIVMSPDEVIRSGIERAIDYFRDRNLGAAADEVCDHLYASLENHTARTARLTDTERKLREATERVMQQEEEIAALRATLTQDSERLEYWLKRSEKRCERLEGEKITDIQVIPWEPGQIGVAIKRANGLRAAWPVETAGEPVTRGHLRLREQCEGLEGALVNMLWQYGGVNDCVDNAGNRFQSEAAYRAEAEARAALAPEPDAKRNRAVEPGDWKLYVCDHERGRDFLHSWGEESSARNALQREAKSGRDVWVIAPDGTKILPREE